MNSLLGWNLTALPYIAAALVIGCAVGWLARELRDWLARRYP